MLSGGNTISIQAGNEGGRFILLGAAPIGEEIARGGPFVMNTREEVQQAFEDYQTGNF